MGAALFHVLAQFLAQLLAVFDGPDGDYRAGAIGGAQDHVAQREQTQEEGFFKLVVTDPVQFQFVGLAVEHPVTGAQPLGSEFVLGVLHLQPAPQGDKQRNHQEKQQPAHNEGAQVDHLGGGAVPDVFFFAHGHLFVFDSRFVPLTGAGLDRCFAFFAEILPDLTSEPAGQLRAPR